MADEQAWEELIERANRLVREAYELLPFDHPVGCVQWIPLWQVQANDWNPNSVAHIEMKLLHISISEDGYTQPVVAIWDPEAGNTPACSCGNIGVPGELIQHHLPGCEVLTRPQGRYVIVDGFHRYTTMQVFEDIAATTHGYLPVVVLDKPVADRMASTVRHNRARGKHSVAGMGALVFGMLNEGQSDAQICNKLGMEPEELARLKHITGYSKLYSNAKYTAVTQSTTQMQVKSQYAAEHPGEQIGRF
jgi:hypothetical protein